MRIPYVNKTNLIHLEFRDTLANMFVIIENMSSRGGKGSRLTAQWVQISRAVEFSIKPLVLDISALRL